MRYWCYEKDGYAISCHLQKQGLNDFLNEEGDKDMIIRKCNAGSGYI
jgi:hypothetical protein